MLIEHALVESATGERMHRCFGGALVPYGSQECIDDIAARMSDAIQIRNQCGNRTDERTHYNGVLNVLRRNMRDAQKYRNAYVESDSGDSDIDNLLLDREV